MIANFLICFNTTIFLILSSIHIYWAFGGKWAIEYTIPEKFKEHYFQDKNKLKVSVATIIVAIGLIIFSIITASNYFNIEHIIEKNWSSILTQIIGAIFILRAIGDFNVCGIFKKESTSKFANKDNQIFIPLCFYLGISSILIPILQSLNF